MNTGSRKSLQFLLDGPRVCRLVLRSDGGGSGEERWTQADTVGNSRKASLPKVFVPQSSGEELNPLINPNLSPNPFAIGNRCDSNLPPTLAVAT
jgi:hypothetical protein